MLLTLAMSLCLFLQGDVSNNAASRASKAKKEPTPAVPVAAEQQPRRRSRRLSKDAEEAINPAEEEEETEHPVRKKSLRASTKAKTQSSLETADQKEQSQSSRPQRVARSNSNTSKAAAKRSRQVTEEEEEEVPTGKVARRSSRGQVSKSSSTTTTAASSKKRPGRSHSNAAEPKKPCSDFLPHTDYGLVRVPFDPSKYTAGISPHDLENVEDVAEVSNYVTDIYQRLYNQEVRGFVASFFLVVVLLVYKNSPRHCLNSSHQTVSNPSPYMDQQPLLNGMMRSILIDWLVEVHMKFRLMPETLYLSVNIIDRYLSIVQVERQKLQLVGVTSLLIACKYEEIYPPEVKDCVYITDRAYTRQDVLDMEAHIVKKLQFRMTVPTGHPFLVRYLHIIKATKLMKNLANYYMERMLQEYSTLSYRPSLVAAAAVCLAMNNPDVLEYESLEEDSAPGVVSTIFCLYVFGAGINERL
jgi:hypothetical protein